MRISLRSISQQIILKRMARTSVSVLTKSWKIIVRSDKLHLRYFPETHAIAVLDDRKIHVRKSSVNAETFIHELVHAYQYELSFYELQLDDDQVEEWFAELMAKYGETMIRDAKELVSRLSK
jgi:hypothetical protein